MIFGEKDFCGKWGQSHKKIEKATSEQFSLLQVPGMFRKREIHITSDHHAIKKSTNKKKMTEKITSLRAQRGGATATTLCRKWQALPKSMKSNALRLLLLLAILFIPAMRANAEEWDMITCLNVSQDLRQSQTSDKGLATITMTNNSWFYWEQKKSDPWAGLMHFTRTQDKKGEGYHAEFKISAKEGYYITKVIFRDTEGCGKYSNELGLTRLTMYSTQSSEYDRKFDEYSLDNYVDASKKGKYQDNNNLVF